MKNKRVRRIIFVIMVLALASLSCGVSGLPFLATETPTPTFTFKPSPTFTPSPTATSTPTHRPSPTPLPTGVEVEERQDGSTLFIDYDNHYQLVIPVEWVVIPLSAEDLAGALQSMSEENPELRDIAEAFSQLDPDVVRVIAINDDLKYSRDGFATNFTVVAVEDTLMSSMPMDFVVGALEESLIQQGGTLISEYEVYNNDNGVEVGVFEFERLTPTANGNNVTVRIKTVLFQVDDKLVIIQLTVPPGFAVELYPMMDEVADSIQLIDP